MASLMEPLIDCLGNASLTYVNYGEIPVIKTMMGFSFCIALLSDRSPFFSTDSSESMLALVQQTSSYLQIVNPCNLLEVLLAVYSRFVLFMGAKTQAQSFKVH